MYTHELVYRPRHMTHNSCTITGGKLDAIDNSKRAFEKNMKRLIDIYYTSQLL